MIFKVGFLTIFIVLILKSQQSDADMNIDLLYNSTKFSLEIYRTILQDHLSQNVVFSPYALQIILSLLYHSSYGTTEVELQDTAYFIDPQYTHSINTVMFSDFVTNLYIKLGNRVYYKPNAKLNQTFKTALDDFEGTSKKIAFRDQMLVADDINTWVDEQTGDTRKLFITPEKIHRTMDLIFLSTIFLTINLKIDYTNETLLTRAFKGHNRQEHSAQFIQDNNVYKAVLGDEEIKADAIEINLVDDSHMSLLIIMPHETSSVREIANLLNVDYFIDIITKIKDHDLDLIIPLLNVESTIDSRKQFIEFGVKTLENDAEINLFENRNVTNVSKILHKTKLLFNPRDVESEIEPKQEVVGLRASLVIDRPFIYMILVRRTKLPMFIGHYMKP